MRETISGQPNTRVDDQAEPFSGAHRYTLTLAADQIPPAATFWNLSLYRQPLQRHFDDGTVTPARIGATWAKICRGF